MALLVDIYMLMTPFAFVSTMCVRACGSARPNHDYDDAVAGLVVLGAGVAG